MSRRQFAFFIIIFGLLVKVAIAVLVYPGAHNYDIVYSCILSIKDVLNPWHSIYLGILFKFLLNSGISLAELYLVVTLSTGILLGYIAKEILPVRFLSILVFLLSLLFPAMIITSLKLTRDSLVALTLLVAVVSAIRMLKCKEAKQIRLAKLGVFLSLLSSLCVRPDTIAVVFPFMFLLFYRSTDVSIGRKKNNILRAIFLSVFAIATLVVSHLFVKSSLIDDKPILSKTSHHVYLLDLWMIARLNDSGISIPNFPSGCSLSADEVVKHFGYNKHAYRTFRDLMSAKDCSGIDFQRDERIFVAWRRAIIANPWAYLKGRLVYSAAFLGMLGKNIGGVGFVPKEHWRVIRPNYHFKIQFKESGEQLNRCLPSHNRTLSAFATKLLYFLKSQRSSFLVKGWFYMMIHLACLVVFSRRGLRYWQNQLGLCVSLSAIASLFTFTLAGPATGYRYLSWIITSSCVAIYCLMSQNSGNAAEE